MADWIPLMEYAMKNGVSLSTLRRHIKSGKVQSRMENGRYLLFTGAPESAAQQQQNLQDVNSAKSNDAITIALLQAKLEKAQEENAELKTLIAFYEENPPKAVAPKVFNLHGNG